MSSTQVDRKEAQSTFDVLLQASILAMVSLKLPSLCAIYSECLLLFSPNGAAVVALVVKHNSFNYNFSMLAILSSCCWFRCR